MHSKQWHYSLHRDFQNCYSTRISPTGFFSSNSTRVPIHHPHLHMHSTIQRILHPESNSTCRRQRALRVLLLHYRGQRDLHSRFQKRNSMHRRQGDLLEIHPCVLQDIPGIQPQDLPKASSYYRHSSLSRHSRHSSLSSLSRHSSHSRHSRDIPDIPVIYDLPAFQAILQVPVSPVIPTHSSVLQLECIFYIFYSLIGFHRNSSEYQLNNTNNTNITNITFFKEREML